MLLNASNFPIKVWKRLIQEWLFRDFLDAAEVTFELFDTSINWYVLLPMTIMRLLDDNLRL